MTTIQAKPFRIAWFVAPEELAQDSDRLAALHASLGLDLLWLESGRFHTAGYRLSDEVWRTSPLHDWRDRPGLALERQIRHTPDPLFAVLPGVLGGADDADLGVATRAAHDLGIEVWGHMGLWSYGALVYPELAARQLDGQPVPLEEAPWGDCFCPSKPDLNRWLEECLRDVVGRYPHEGIELDHARYVPPASIPNLLVCACDDCARQAAGWGIALPELAETLIAGWRRLRTQPASIVLAALLEACSPLEALDRLFPGPYPEGTASRWFGLRSRQLSSAVLRMAQVAHQAAGRPFRFGIDVLPPSVSALTGHDYADLAGLDYLTGGFGIPGWDNVGVTTCREWTRWLCRQWPALDERQLLAGLYRLFGFENLDLPPTPSGLDELDSRTRADVAMREIEMMARVRPAGSARPSVYAPLPVTSLGAYAPAVLRRAAQVGLDGVILAGLESLSSAQRQSLAQAMPGR